MTTYSDLLAFASKAPAARVSTPQYRLDDKRGLTLNTRAKALVAQDNRLNGIFTAKGNPITARVKYALASEKYAPQLINYLQELHIEPAN